MTDVRWKAALLVAVLALNASRLNAATEAAVLAVGVAALLASAPSRRIIAVWLGSMLLGLATAAGLVWVSRDGRAAALVVVRVAAGSAWCLWFATTASWGQLRAWLSRGRFASDVVDAADLAVAQGSLLRRELNRRMDAAGVRLGLQQAGDVLPTCGLVLSGAVDRAIDRGVVLEDVRALRAAPRPTSALMRAGGGCFELQRVTVDGKPGAPARLVDLSVRLRSGEFAVVLGPSGSGKSTLLRLIAGLERPATGCLLRFDTRVEAPNLRRRVDGRVALVFQEPDDQFLCSTPLADVAWGLERRGVPEGMARAEAAQALDELGIIHLADRPPHELSFGEKRRVALAGALAARPELLLCDEPTSGLDPLAAHRLTGLIERFARRNGATVLWVTHDLQGLPPAAERVLLLRSGRLVFDGTRVAALARPRLVEAGLALPEGGSDEC